MASHAHDLPACSRRRFLQTGSALAGANLAGANLTSMSQWAAARSSDRMPRQQPPAVHNCITILLVGSPGHVDTWDMKPAAPSEIRGPFRPIATSVPGIEICEHFPRLASLADRLVFVRGMHHHGPPLHETGQRFAMTGADFGIDHPRPHSGSVVAHLAGPRGNLPASVVLPPLGDTGAGHLHGQTAGWLGDLFEPATLSSGDDIPALGKAFDIDAEPPRTRERYGVNAFGRDCLRARRLVEHGVRSVTVNHFTTAFGSVSWDLHAAGSSLPTTFADYQRIVCPQFDQAFSALLSDLEERGLLAETVVAVVSEMGRAPRINRRGGRDHFTRAWTNLLAGGPVRGGQVVGATDCTGSEIVERPVDPAQWLATVYRARGIDLDQARMPGADGAPLPLVDARPLAEIL